MNQVATHSNLTGAMSHVLGNILRKHGFTETHASKVCNDATGIIDQVATQSNMSPAVFQELVRDLKGTINASYSTPLAVPPVDSAWLSNLLVECSEDIRYAPVFPEKIDLDVAKAFLLMVQANA